MESVDAKILNEVFLTMPVVIYTRKNFHLLEALNINMEMLKNAGLVTLWYKRSLKSKMKSKIEEPAQPLDFKKLSGCFKVVVAGWTASLIIFMLEISYHKIRRK